MGFWQRLRSLRMFEFRSAEMNGRELEYETRDRLIFVGVLVAALFVAVQARLVYLAMQEPEKAWAGRLTDIGLAAARPEIRDRNGRVMALDIQMQSLFAEPKVIDRPEETFEALSGVLPELDYDDTMAKLTNRKRGFIWLKREITPAQQQEILKLGLPGIDFRSESRRFYPDGRTAAHILGYTDIDNKGLAGIERHLDRNGLRALQESGFALGAEMEPVTLSVDMRVQHFLHEGLREAMKTYRAKAASGIVLDVHTGEVMALASLPDFDPNQPIDAQKDDRINRVSYGRFEMGSTFKLFTSGMVLDAGTVSLNSRFDTRGNIRLGRHSVGDYKGKNRVLSVPEIFIYSSNIGTARMAETVSMDHHRAFLEQIGVSSRIEDFELPEVRSPSQPKKWRRDSAVTISYGHGLSTTQLNQAMAASAMVNGGILIPPTLMPRSREKAVQLGKRVISDATSEKLRYLMRLNVIKGSGKRADVPGYQVGGKTGTANKLIDGKYSKKISFNSFLSTFPATDPKYVVLVSIDEPKPVKDSRYSTAGLNAAPTVGKLVRKIAPLLGVKPDFTIRNTARLAAYRR